VLAIVGGLSNLAGYRAKLGGWIIVLFLVPVTWMSTSSGWYRNPMMAQIK